MRIILIKDELEDSTLISKSNRSAWTACHPSCGRIGNNTRCTGVCHVYNPRVVAVVIDILQANELEHIVLVV